MWSVEEVHVSHMISITRMSKRLSKKPTARLIMHRTARCHACPEQNQPNIDDMSYWSLDKNYFLINNSRDETSHCSYSMRQVISKCYEFGDVRKKNY